MLNNKKTGFTIIELLVVIVVIAVLLSLTVFAFGNWRERTARTEVRSDLKAAMSAMESARNFSNGYPIATASGTVPPSAAFKIDTFDESTYVDLTYISGTSTTYCLRGASTSVVSVIYYVNPPSNAEPTTTACS